MGEKLPDCCEPKKESEGIVQGIIYGIIPHIGCIAFIFFTIFGVTAATALFRPLLMSRYFFYILIAFSFVMALVSSIIYLYRKKLLSWAGVKRKKKYLGVMFGTTIGINLLLFLIIFPLTANTGGLTGAATNVFASGSQLSLEVDIPCPGHAPLISGDLKEIEGVEAVQFSFPNIFDVGYNSQITSEEEILSLDVFDEYPATVISSGGGEVIETTSTGGSCCGGPTCGSAQTGTCGCGG